MKTLFCSIAFATLISQMGVQGHQVVEDEDPDAFLLEHESQNQGSVEAETNDPKEEK